MVLHHEYNKLLKMNMQTPKSDSMAWIAAFIAYCSDASFFFHFTITALPIFQEIYTDV